uniref:Protein kinase domain-containing protein n=1 Tax=Panagrellus redivivus TaxID=6233 RepID=A0A7E4UQS0_PANRE
MVFLPKDAVMSAEEAANVIKVDEIDHYNEEWTPPFDARNSVLLKRNEKFTDWYDIFECLGEGKFGKVYRCCEKATGLELAAKCIRLKRDADMKQVEKEVSFMTRMHHKCIAQIYDAFAISNNEVVLIMEMVQGGELFDRVVEENYVLTETAVALIVYQICEAMQYIHSHNIIHLDLKPENIMCVSQTGNQIKLIDFGLAQYYDGEHDLLFMAGTPEFAAPEVIKFEPLDFHTDMWSVGVIVYILLSGESPFLGDNLALTYFNVERGNWEFCEEFDDNGVSDEARDFISKLLILDKSKRMLPAECLQHPWITSHLEKARQNALMHREDESSKIDTRKLRSYVRNKNFRRLVFGVLFVNSIVRIFNTMKEKNSATGIQYVQNMLNAANEGENGGPSEERGALLKAALMSKRRKPTEEAPSTSEIVEAAPSQTATEPEDFDKTRRLDSGLGEGSTKVSAVEGPDDEFHAPVTPTLPITPKEPVGASPPTTQPYKTEAISEENASAEERQKPKPKEAEVQAPTPIKKLKKTSTKVSHDSALSPVVVVPVVESKTAVTTTPASDTLAVSTTTGATTATSEDDKAPKKKIIRRKKVPKPVLTLRDCECPVVMEKKTKKIKKKSVENTLDENVTKINPDAISVSRKSTKEEKDDATENAETQSIQTLISKRRSSADKRAAGGLVGNLLAKLEQQSEKTVSPVKFAVSGVVPVRKTPAGLPRPQRPNVQQFVSAASNDIVRVDGKDAKIEKINDQTDVADPAKTNIELTLERKVVSEKESSIKQKTTKEKSSTVSQTSKDSQKASTSTTEVALKSTTQIEERSKPVKSVQSKALFEQEVKTVERERVDASKILAEKKLTTTSKLGVSQSTAEKDKKLSERSLRVKQSDEKKASLLVKAKSGLEARLDVEDNKTTTVEATADGIGKSTTTETKVAAVSTNKSPKATVTKKTKTKTKKINPKNRSMDDLLDDRHPAGHNHKSLATSNELLSAAPLSRNPSFHNKSQSQSTNDLQYPVDQKQRRSLVELDTEEIEQIQAREKEAFDFGNLREQLERRVSGARPIDEFEAWRQAKARELRSSLHDNGNIKRAMKKWITMDKANK